MKKVRLLLFVVCMVMILSLTLVACGEDVVEENGKIVTEIRIESGVSIADITTFDLSQFTIKVYFSDGTDETVQLSNDMVSEEDRLALQQEGTHTFTVTYKEKTVDVTVTLVIPTYYSISYELPTETDLSLNETSLTKTLYSELEGNYTLPELIPQPGMQFDGWYTSYDYKEETLITEIDTKSATNYKLYAKFSNYKASLTYILNGGRIEEGENPTLHSMDMDDFTLINPIKDGYNFIGWSVNGSSELYTTYTIYTGDYYTYTFEANWEIDRSNYAFIEFETNGGSIINGMYVVKGECVTMPSNPTKEGYTFGGWYLDSALSVAFDSNQVVEDAFILYAKWNKIVKEFEYVECDTGYALKAYGGTASEVIIPSEYNNQPVVEIYGLAFDSNTTIKSVVVPNSVQIIGAGAFMNCNNIESISVPFTGESRESSHSELSYIFGGTLDIPKSLTAVTVTDATTIFGSSFQYGENISTINISCNATTIADFGFSGLTKLKTINLPNTLVNIGSCAFQECVGLENITIPSSVKYISSSAFSGCSSLLEIVIPNSVEFIGSFSLSGCTSIKTVTIPFIGESLTATEEYSQFYKLFGRGEDVPESLESVIVKSGTNVPNNAFCNCKYIKSIILPETIESIGYYAFYGCDNLTNVNIPESVKTIGNNAFYWCQKLEEVSIPSGVELIDESVFSECVNLKNVIIPETIKRIATYAFNNCTSLKEIVLPNSLECINGCAFNGCTSLESITLPFVGEYKDGSGNTSIKSLFSLNNDNPPASLKNITITLCETIGDNAFDNCYNIESITLPNTLKSIGVYAFYNCKKIKTLKLADEITSIGDYAFSYCESLESINIPSSISNLPSNFLSNCKSLKSIIIPENVEIIGDTAFAGCSSISEIVVPSKVNIIYGCAFYGCTSLEEVTLNSGLKTLCAGAFENCTSLTDITIPSGLEKLYHYVFRGCTSLESITLPFVSGVVQQFNNFSNLFGDSIENIPASLKTVNVNGTGEIGSNAFDFCSGLEAIILPNTINKINNNAFAGCTGLTTIEIPASVIYIGSYAFGECSFTDFVVPNTVEYIGAGAFSFCNSLESITLPFIGDSLLNPTDTQFATLFYTWESVPSTLKKVKVTNTNIAPDKAFYYCVNIEEIEFVKPLTTINAISFYQCTSLKTLDLSSVTTIGENAFGNCTSFIPAFSTSLKTIGSYAFSYCTGIENLEIPSSVNDILNYAFTYCTGIKTLVLPNTNLNLNNGSFDNCTGLTEITIPMNVVANKGAFSNCTSIKTATISYTGFNKDDTNHMEFYNLFGDSVPESLTKVIYTDDAILKENAFYNCLTIKEVVLPSGITEIKDFMFYNCDGLKTFTIPSTVETIGDYAFQSCDNLSSITFNEGLLTIGFASFNSCSQLSDISLPSSLNSLGRYAFSGCKLTNVVIPENVTNIGDQAFNDNPLVSITMPFVGLESTNNSNSNLNSFFGSTSYVPNTLTTIIVTNTNFVGENAFAGITSIKNITLPSNLVSIGNYAFSGCTGLDSITLPSTLKTIGTDAFRGCTGLSELILPSGLETVSSYAFEDCTGLTSMTIPNSVSSIGSCVFGGCTSLNSISIPFLGGSLDTETTPYLYYDFGLNNYTEIPSSLKTVTITKCTKIAEKAFSYCSNLTNINLPNTLTQIDSLAFFHCTSLKNITIPSNVNVIKANILQGCEALETVTFEGAGDWYTTSDSTCLANKTGGTLIDLSNPADNATLLKASSDYLYRKTE